MVEWRWAGERGSVCVGVNRWMGGCWRDRPSMFVLLFTTDPQVLLSDQVGPCSEPIS